MIAAIHTHVAPQRERERLAEYLKGGATLVSATSGGAAPPAAGAAAPLPALPPAEPRRITRSIMVTRRYTQGLGWALLMAAWALWFVIFLAVIGLAEWCWRAGREDHASQEGPQ